MQIVAIVIAIATDLGRKLILIAIDQIDSIKLAINQKVLLKYFMVRLVTIQKDQLKARLFASRKDQLKAMLVVIQKDQLTAMLVVNQKDYLKAMLITIQKHYFYLKVWLNQKDHLEVRLLGYY